jgi:hypothetical protein
VILNKKKAFTDEHESNWQSESKALDLMSLAVLRYLIFKWLTK